MTRSWRLADAKAKLSELVDDAQRSPQIITRRGAPVAVVLSHAHGERLREEAARPRVNPMTAFLAFCESLRSEGPLDLPLPRRRATRGRPSPFER